MSHVSVRRPQRPTQSLGCCSACAGKSQGVGAYQAIMSPGPSSNRFPFHGVDDESGGSSAALGWAVLAVVAAVIVFSE